MQSAQAWERKLAHSGMAVSNSGEKKAAQRVEKAREAEGVGGCRVSPTVSSPPPPYNSSLEDE